MKDYIELHYPDQPRGRQYTYKRLRGIIQEAWDSITPNDLQDVIGTMRERCQAVIDACGGHTKY
jgi:hypothetical protein